MDHAARLCLSSLLLAALLGACAHAAPAAPTAGPAGPRFAGLKGVDVQVFTDLPDSVGAPLGLRSLQVRERVVAQLREAGVPVVSGTGDPAGGEPNLDLRLHSFAIGPGDHAVWVEVGLSELILFPRRSTLPLMVTTWGEEGKTRLQGDDPAGLWSVIGRLTRAFIREYQAANPAAGAAAAAPR